MDTSKKIERAYTSKDVKSQECAMISKLGSQLMRDNVEESLSSR